MLKQIILTVGNCREEFQQHLDLKTIPEKTDTLETFEVLFGAITNIAKDVLEQYKKYDYEITGNSPEAITGQTMNELVKLYISYIKRMHECDDY